VYHCFESTSKKLFVASLCGFALTSVSIVGCGSQTTETGSSSGSSTSSSSSATPAAKPTAKVKINEAEVKAAVKTVAEAVRQISFMTDDAGFEKSRTGKDNAHGIIDVPAVKKALEVVSVLPDNKENQFMPVFSVQLAKMREIIELYEAAIKSGKPFTDGSETGPKMAKLAADHELSFTVASGESINITEKQ
jgi:hypothetical protein